MYIPCTRFAVRAASGLRGLAHVQDWEIEMARPRKQARILQWRGAWTLFYFDAATGKERRVSCQGVGATTPEARAELVKQYRIREKSDAADVVRRGGRLAYDTLLTEAIARYRADVAERAGLRIANPESREGLANGSMLNINDTLNRFDEWLVMQRRPRLTTAEIDSKFLGRFFAHLAAEPTRHGNREVKRSAATLNMHRRNLRAGFHWMAALRPPLFPDFPAVLPAFKLKAGDTEMPAAFGPQTLSKFLATALDREAPEFVSHVVRLRGGKVERFEQGVSAKAQTPTSRLFLLLALVGCRLGEALALRWDDIDLARGRVTIRAQKTGRTRIVPLIGAPEGIIAPKFLELLRLWRMQAGDRVFVLPHGELTAPFFCKSGWQLTNTAAKLARLGPQMLRQNFCAYAASLGVPATVAALWQGHGAAVAERWYRAQVLDRADGETFEDAMGLAPVIQRLLANTKATGKSLAAG